MKLYRSQTNEAIRHPRQSRSSVNPNELALSRHLRDYISIYLRESLSIGAGVICKFLFYDEAVFKHPVLVLRVLGAFRRDCLLGSP